MAGCQREDPKWTAIIVKNSSSATQPPQNLGVKEADEPHITQTLLMRAGDVESNPGPKRKHKIHSKKEDDFDDILEDVARLIPDNKNINTLGKALGFDPAEIERYIATNTRYQDVTYDGTLKMLRDWRNTQRKAKERPVLAHALREAKLERFGDTLLMNSEVPDLQTTSDDLPQHDLLESVVKDIKKYYTRNMCTIQADPTNHDLTFKLNRIYINPTLFKEDRYDKTKRKPLLYRNLLKKDIYGHMPNRLLVQAEGGSGKTTFCAKIAWDWVHRLGFKQFKLVAVIPLRKAKNKTVGDVIKSYLSDDNPFTAAQIDNYILSNQKDVFLVFDGLDELGGKFSDIEKIILNQLFMSGTVLITSRQWRVHKIRSITELKKVYSCIHIEGFSVDDVAEYITNFFKQDADSSQELIDFITRNNIIANNMARFPIYINMLCTMWREYEGERQEAMSNLTTFPQLFAQMVDFLVDHSGFKADSQTGPTAQELRQMIPNHLKAIGEIALQGILDRRLEFPEDIFRSCRESMEMGFKVGVLTREKRATPRRERRKNAHLQMSMVQFPHQLFQEFMAAKYLASLHSSDHNKYERIMADILRKKEEIRFLLYFTSAQGSELGLDIVDRLIAQEANDYIILDEAYESNDKLNQLMKLCKFLEIPHDTFARVLAQETNDDIIPDEASKSKFHLITNEELSLQTKSRKHNLGSFLCYYSQEKKEHFIVDVAYESQHKSVAERVGNKLIGSRKPLEITDRWSAHTVSGLMFIKDHLREVDSLSLNITCNRINSQDLAQFILSSASLRTMEIGSPMHAVFYSVLAKKAQQCQIQNLKIYMNDLGDQPSRDLAEFICQMPHLESLELCYTYLHDDFFSNWASIVSSAEGHNQSTTPHTSLRELIVDDHTMAGWQSCADMFNSVEKFSICFWTEFECDFIKRVHGFQGVTELSILGRVWTTPCEVKGEPSTMFRQLVRFFPQLIKMTFRIHLSNAVLKQILESLRETRGLPLKSVRVLKCATEDGLDELSTLINRINEENVFRVDMEPIRDETLFEQCYRQSCKLDSNEGSNDDDESGDKCDDDDEWVDMSDDDDDDDYVDECLDESCEKSNDDDESGDECVDRSNDDSHIESDEHSFHESGDGLDDESGDKLDDESGDGLDDESGDGLDDESQRASGKSNDKYTCSFC